MRRREFLAGAAAGLGLSAAATGAPGADSVRRPNLVYVFADQWRAQATGYAGDPNVHTPHADALLQESVHFRNAVATCPVCSPYRGSLLTGLYPHAHGVFLNDVRLRDDGRSFAHVLAAAGYRTAYLGKWHLDGGPRSGFTPPERRQGFQYWRGLQCTHDYNASRYYDDAGAAQLWPEYDALAQTRDAQRYIEAWDGQAPFALFLSWGPPHTPYDSAPESYRRRYDPASLRLRPNVPEARAAQARIDLAGYYAHCTALDQCLGDLLGTLEARGIAGDTLFVFTSDHGDMLESQGHQRKQRPWDESVRVPLLLRCPRLFGSGRRTIDRPIGTPDLMPMLLELCGVPVPPGVQGESLAGVARGSAPDGDGAALIACYTPFGEWLRDKGGREYRGVRTMRYTYVRALDGPWLLYDNESDPYQLDNLCGRPGHRALQDRLEEMLRARLAAAGDTFEPGPEYIRRWGYTVDASGTVPVVA